MGRCVFRRILRFLLARLYNEFAWAYDLVSRTVSRGEWQQWQQAVLPYVTGRRLLEIACGPGDLLLDLGGSGREVFGIDLSASMIKKASQKLRRAGRPLNICRSRAQALPFPNATFNSVVLTFPAPFVLEKTSQKEIYRVLARGGELLIVDQGWLLGQDLWSRLLNWGLGASEDSQRQENLLASSLSQSGFRLHEVAVAWEKSTVKVWIGEKEG